MTQHKRVRLKKEKKIVNLENEQNTQVTKTHKIILDY